jgi:hypothetical protein
LNIEYNFQKSRVTGPWDHKDSVSAKKIIKKFHACVPLSKYIIRSIEKQDEEDTGNPAMEPLLY